MFENLAGQTLGRYDIVSSLGEGTLGAVFKGRDPGLQRDVAIKIIQPALAGRPGFAENFTRLARAAARLDHPNLVQVFDSGQARNFYYLVMEYIPGENLGQLLQEFKEAGRWMLLREAVLLVRQLALALAYVRSQDVPPRTLKPGNVKFKPVQSDRLPYLPVLVDLGLEAIFDGRNSGDAAALGYLSPEAVQGQSTGPRSDVYSLGVLLFELSTGQLPFPIQNLDEAIRYHSRQPVPPPLAIRPDLPEPLAQLILKAMQKNPEDRFPAPAEMAGELENIAPLVEALEAAPPAYEQSVSLLPAFRKSLEEERRASAFEDQAPQPAPTQKAPAQRAPAEVILENAQLSIVPGNSAATRLLLLYEGTTPAQFRLIVQGVPPSWISLAEQVVQVNPGERKEVRLTIRPPRSPHSRAGRYPLTIRANNLQDPKGSAEARGTLTVAAFSQFSSELYSRTMQPEELGKVAVNNLGNVQETFSLNLRDPHGELAFTPPSGPLRLEEGQAGVAEFRIGLRQPHWLGAERNLPFDIQVSAAGGETQAHHGLVVSRALIPVWALGILLLAVLCSAGVLALYFGGSSIQAARATQAIVAQQTGTVVALQSTMAAGTATAEYLANSNEATRAAATVEAAATQTQVAQLGAFATQTVQAESAADATAMAQTQAAASQTAVVQQGTQAALTQTAAAQQATQVAANATATAQAGAAAAATATAAAQTAQPATATAQAATATAQAAANQTATAQAAATQTASAPRQIGYIYASDTQTAGDFQALLQGNNYQVALVPQNVILTTDFTPFQAIMVGPDTGQDQNWGDQGGNQANRLASTGLPILGVGEGGYAFFGRVGLAIGYDKGVKDNGTDIIVADPNSPIWSKPNKVDIPANHTLTLYNSSQPLAAITAAAPQPGLTLIGSEVNDLTQFPLIVQGNKYLLWGFSAGPSAMSNLGQKVFVNALNSLFPNP
jgi:serine/threonine protein kinase